MNGATSKIDTGESRETLGADDAGAADAVLRAEQLALRAACEHNDAQIRRLESELAESESELTALGDERNRHALLAEACDAIDGLEGAGLAELFWADPELRARSVERASSLRAEVEQFALRVVAIEEARDSVENELQKLREEGASLVYELEDAEWEAEQRRFEWVVEREADALPPRAVRMPWHRGAEDDQRLRRSLASALAFSLFLALLLSWVELPVAEPNQPIAVPARLARLVRDEPIALPKPPPVAKNEALQQETSEVAAEEPAKAKEAAPGPADAEPAAKRGLLAFSDQLSDIAKADAPERLGSQARIQRSGEAATGRPTRSLVTTQAPGTSGGVDVAQLRREVGGGSQGISGVEVAKATSSIGGDGAGTGDRPLAGGPGPGRTDEEIQIVFDRHKAALYRLYNRELRKDPTLQGQLVLRLRIEPDGSVSLCELHSSDLDAPELAKNVVARVSGFDFGAKEGVAAITIVYPIDFLPAT